jgi:hypothetical protein
VVQDGEATQLSVGQSVDLALRLTGSVVAVVDGFDFGAETLTIVLPGKYRIEVRNIDPLFPSFSIFSMSRHAVALQQGSLWRAAEASATESKRTGKLSDITASLSR